MHSTCKFSVEKQMTAQMLNWGKLITGLKHFEFSLCRDRPEDGEDVVQRISIEQQY